MRTSDFRASPERPIRPEPLDSDISDGQAFSETRQREHRFPFRSRDEATKDLFSWQMSGRKPGGPDVLMQPKHRRGIGFVQISARKA